MVEAIIDRKFVQTTLKEFLDTKWKLGGSWGNGVWLFDVQGFGRLNPDKDLVKVYGFTPFSLPRVGELLSGEFTNSYMRFEFVKVDPTGDPADGFFADVKCTGQLNKSELRNG